MPNYIKNRIEILGETEEVKKLVERFSTNFEKTKNKSFNGNTIYQNDKGGIGWLDEDTNEFTRRDMEPVSGVPDGYEILYIDEWSRFPDFNKILPKPESLDVSESSVGDIGYAIISGKSPNRFMNFSDYQNRFLSAPIKERIEMINLGLIYVKNEIEYGFKTWYDWSIENWGTKWNCNSCEKESDNVFIFETAWSSVPKLIHLMAKEFPSLKLVYEWSDEDTGSNCGYMIFEGENFEGDGLEDRSYEAFELAFKLRPDSREYYKLIDGNYEYTEED